MGAVSPIAEARANEFARAIDRVNQWRGQMIESFARAEHAVSEALLALAGSGQIKPGTKLPHLTGQRMALLGKVLGSLDDPPAHTQAALKALELFNGNEGLRAGLCHGRQNVEIRQDGSWIVHIKLHVFKSQGVSSSSMTIEEGDANRRLAELSEKRKRLVSVLGQLRKTGSSGRPPS